MNEDTRRVSSHADDVELESAQDQPAVIQVVLCAVLIWLALSASLLQLEPRQAKAPGVAMEPVSTNHGA